MAPRAAARANPVGAHDAALTGPHPRLRICPPILETPLPLAGRIKFIERKPSPNRTVARFEWPAKRYNAIIT
jgi:hypothetical protein